MTPSVGADEIGDLRVGPDLVTRHLLLGDQAAAEERLGEPAHELHPLDHCAEVGVVAVAALVEVVEVDRRAVARVRRSRAGPGPRGSTCEPSAPPRSGS